MGYQWKGYTVFIEKEDFKPDTKGKFDYIADPRELQVEDIPLQPSEQALKAKGLPSPAEATQRERELHELTHLPYRRWCLVCLQAKGKHLPHHALKDRHPVIQIDFAFLSTKEQPGLSITIVTAVDVRTQMSCAMVTPSKQVNRYVLTELRRFILEVGRTQAILQCDDES